MKAKYLQKKALKIPVLVAIMLSLVFPMTVSASAPNERQVAVVSEAEVMEVFEDTNLITLSSDRLAVAETQQLSQAASELSQQERVAQMKAGLEELIDKWELMRNVGRNASYYTAKPSLMHMLGNENVRNAIDRNVFGFRRLGAIAFSDIDDETWYGEYVALGVYSDVITGYPDGTFMGDNGITIREFATLFMRYIEGDNDTRVDAKREEIRNYKEGPHYREGNTNIYFGWDDVDGRHWWAPYFFINTRLFPNIVGFQYPQNAHTAEAYGGTGMSRGDVAVVLCEYYFAPDFRNMLARIEDDGYLPTTFTDITHVNPETTSESFARNSNRIANDFGEGKTDFVWTHFAVLQESRDNQSLGVPVEYLAAMEVLSEKGIMGGYPDGSSGWHGTVSRAEALIFLANVQRYFISIGEIG